MILVDSSVWIDLLGKKPKHKLPVADFVKVYTCPVIIQELLQGVNDDIAHRRLKTALLALPRLGDPLSTDVHLEAADIYRLARRKGYTIRSSVDCLVAALALRADVPVWHADRDYTLLSKITALKVWTGLQFPS